MKFNVHPNPALLGALGGLAVGSLGTLLLARSVYSKRLNAEVADVKNYYKTREAGIFRAADITAKSVSSSVGDAELGDDGGNAKELEGDEAAETANRINNVADALPSSFDYEAPKGLGTGPRSKWTDVVEASLGRGDASDVSVPGTERRKARLNYSTAHRVIEDKPDLAELTRVIPEASPSEPERDTSQPYVIPYAEFFEDHNEDYQKLTITYYTVDNALVDDKDVPIRDITGTIGNGIECFGDQSDDENIVYVRNNKLEIDFEVTRDFRSFAEVVLGYGNPKAAAIRKVSKAD